jgi:anti-sigma B factor antagonist
VVDLSAVTFLGSRGIAALVGANRQSRGEALRVVVDANRPVIRPLEVTGLDEVLALHHSVAEAIEAQARGRSNLVCRHRSR